MKKFLIISSIALAGSTVANAATLVWSAALTRNGFDAADGTDLAVGSLLRAGFFNLSDQQIIDNSTTPSGVQFLNQNFTEFAVAHMGEGVNNTPGHFTNSDSNSGASAMSLAGRQIYLWAFRSADSSTDALSVSTATQHGIFYLPFATDADWRFPTDVDTGSTTIAIRDMTDTTTSTALRAETRILAGSFGPGTTISLRPAFTLVAVPEPSSALLALAGGTAFLLRRRRK